MKVRLIIIPVFVLLILAIGWSQRSLFLDNPSDSPPPERETDNMQNLNMNGIFKETEPLSIDALRQYRLDATRIEIEEMLPAGSNYSRFIASYTSEGNKIYGLLTIPNGEKPASGFPVIIFNHGYIPPLEYRTTERYVAYQDGFARNGYITFKSDYRGHGNSEGDATGGYGSNGYTVDVLNAVEAVKKMDGVDDGRIGMWGHSMGGFITLRAMVVRKDIKAGVIWGGVVASYPDLISNWRRDLPTPRPMSTGARRWRQVLVEKYGEPSDSSAFWRSLSANSYLEDISGPIQLHHGTYDDSVPYSFSETLEQQLNAVSKPVELYLYENDDHDITYNFGTAIQRSIEFFDRYVKGT